jgi:hypothetical protein
MRPHGQVAVIAPLEVGLILRGSAGRRWVAGPILDASFTFERRKGMCIRGNP